MSLAGKNMQNRTAERLARLGYIARGVVYVLVGGLAILAALGHGRETADSQGAFEALLSQPLGAFWVGAVGMGLICFAIWRFLQSILDADNLGREWRAVFRRLSFGIGGVANAGLGFSALEWAVGMARSVRSGDGSTRDWTAYLLSAPLGQWLVGIISLVMIGVGSAIALKGLMGSFTRELTVDRSARHWIQLLGRIGFMARGLVFVLIGGFLLTAAIYANAREARGLAGALMALQEQPYGPALLAATAIGLFAFGIFQFAVAYYRPIKVPDARVVKEEVRQSVKSAATAVEQ
jgi:hypothetical protein